MDPTILIRRLTGTGKGKEETLQTQEISLGTGPNNTVRFDSSWDRGVATSHARVWRDEGGTWWLQDAGSSTGTFVNGQRITTRRKVGGATVIELGQNGPKVEVMLPALAAEAAARKAAQAGGGAGKWLAIAAVLVLGGAGAFMALKKSPNTDAEAPTPAAAGTISWKPRVDMGEQIFPSYLVAIATMKQTELPNAQNPSRLGDPGGVLCVEITSPKDAAKVSVQFEPNSIIRGASIQAELPKQGETYHIYPKVDYHYDALLKVRQAVPLTLTAKVAVDGVEESKAITVRLCSINDCPFIVGDNSSPDSQKYEECTWMFAAYVNENHPFSEEIRKEALKSGAITQFVGYQRGPDEVARQVFAIWNVLQQRGVRYSSVTTISGNNDSVAAQQVRFVDQTINSSQANCADGSVIFASILRQVGIEPALVVVPGHMFVGFYLERGDPDSLVCLETTMMGKTDLSKISSVEGLPSKASSLEGLPPSLQSGVKTVVESNTLSEAQVTASIESFKNAVQVGNKTYGEYRDKIEKHEDQSGLIKIEDARKDGVMPIAYQP